MNADSLFFGLGVVILVQLWLIYHELQAIRKQFVPPDEP